MRLCRRFSPQAVVFAVSGTLALLAAMFTIRSLASPVSTLTASATSVSQESTITLTGEGFAPDEQVGLWQTLPDFTVTPLEQQLADGAGHFSTQLFFGSNLPVGRHTITARGLVTGREEYLDINLSVAQGSSPDAGVVVTPITRVERQGDTLILRGSGFGITEDVVLWGRFPDGGSFDLARVSTNSQGQFEVAVGFGGNPTGTYVFSAQGLNTGLFTFTEMTLEVGDLNSVVATASLVARPSSGDQQRFVTLEGYGFAADESVTIWATQPDNSTVTLAEVVTSEQGTLVAQLFLDETVPVGQHIFSARGNRSGILATAPYFLDAGGGPRQP